MKEIVTIPGNRVLLYASCTAILATMLVAGFVYDPQPDLSVKDLEASLAIHMNMEDYVAAREDIRKLEHLNPDHLYAKLMAAYIHNISGEYTDALARYREALPLAKNHPTIADDIWDTVGILAMRSGLYDEAKAEAQGKIKAFGENVLSRLIIALSSFSLNDDRNYEENLTKAMEMGILDPAFTIRLDSLVEDKEMLQKLYIRSLLDRAKYERQLVGSIW
ncbi:MAG: hypothetical protein KJ645_08860 [Planctomycetes bacterium]|nr:hypothetical protein [Planctomycetota bacterium]